MSMKTGAPPTGIHGVISLLIRAFKPYKKRILLLVSLSVVGSFLEGIGINAIIPLFSFLNKDTVDGSDMISQFIVQFFAFFHLNFSFRYVFAFIIIVFILKALVLLLIGWLAATLAADYEKNIRAEAFNLTLRARWPYLVFEKAGYLDQVLTTDVMYTSTLLLTLSSTIILVTNFFIYSILIVNISPIIAVLTFAVGGVVFFLFKPFFRKNKQASQKVGVMYKDVAHFSIEQMMGMKTIKSASAEQPISAKIIKYFTEIRRFNVRVTVLRYLTNALMQPVGVVFIMGLFAYFYTFSRFNFAAFAVLVFGINKVFANLQLAQGQAHSIISMIPYLHNVLSYRDRMRGEQEADPGTRSFALAKEIMFDRISFAYGSRDQSIHFKDGQAPTVFDNLSLTIARGETVGIVGPSGAGKTTIVDLLLRLFTPDTGRITLDGVPADEFSLADWRRHIGYVSQDIFLTNGTVADNIRFYDSSLTTADIERAVEAAHLTDFVSSQPLGLDTPVGDRGVLLSGGQRQRVALARVLARQPDVLILDEATSALDNESEAQIRAAIRDLRGRVTIIMIAHRLSTIMDADRLIVLEKGTIVETGAPKDLLADTQSYFHKMAHVTRDTEIF